MPELEDGVILAKNLWNNGLSPDRIADRLASRRYEKSDIDRILRTLPEGRPDNLMVRPPASGLGRTLTVGAGLLVLGLGVTMMALSRAQGGPQVLIFGVPFAVVGVVLINAGRS